MLSDGRLRHSPIGSGDSLRLDAGWRPAKSSPTFQCSSSGGSVACRLRIVISAARGEGNPTEVSISSNSSLAQRVRKCSSDSHTPMMYNEPLSVRLR